MAVIKVLGQSNPAAATPTTIYTVPAATATVISSLTVCNRGSATSFRIAIRPAGAALSNEHYLYFDVAIPANDTFIATVGLTLATTDVVTVYATDASLSFSLFGQETDV